MHSAPGLYHGNEILPAALARMGKVAWVNTVEKGTGAAHNSSAFECLIIDSSGSIETLRTAVCEHYLPKKGLRAY